MSETQVVKENRKESKEKQFADQVINLYESCLQNGLIIFSTKACKSCFSRDI